MKWGVFYEESEVPPMDNFTDGAHIFVFSTSMDYPQRIIPLEDDGWEVRDCLKIFNGKQDRQVALLRKPFKGTIASNVLKNGCGGLNIDDCRIGNIVQDTSKNGRAASSHKATIFESGLKKDFEGQITTGRFPANLILTHTPECKNQGFKQVKGDGHAPKLSKGNPFGGSNDQPHDEHYFKQETVGDYLCSPNCPVQLLNTQSQVPKSKKAGAVRFFFNAETRNQVVAYLRRMINPN